MSINYKRFQARRRRTLAAGAWIISMLGVVNCVKADDRIYRSRSATGQVVYANDPSPGSELMIQLPPAVTTANDGVSRLTTSFGYQPANSSASTFHHHSAIQSLIRQAARRHGLDVDLLMALIRQESGFDPLAVSRAGARGLMQLMPATAHRYGVTRIHDPGENIAAGSAYLSDLIRRFGRIDLALAAYNAGEGAVEKHGNQIPPFPETQQYVKRVLENYRERKLGR